MSSQIVLFISTRCLLDVTNCGFVSFYRIVYFFVQAIIIFFCLYFQEAIDGEHKTCKGFLHYILYLLPFIYYACTKIVSW